ncbi:MAG: phosphoesterase, partial [Marinirhabdus sp.]
KNKNKTILFAMHHPMFTNGAHGGFFAPNKHLYPTQKPIPAPGFASIIAQVRSQGGVSVQDRYNELSNKFMDQLAEIAKKHGRLVFASGHEHTLQHIEADGLVQILSGSGAKASYAALGENGLFSYGGQGFAVYDVFTDGASFVRYYGADGANNPKLLFQKEVVPARKPYNMASVKKLTEKKKNAAILIEDSTSTPAYFKTIWGAKYKKAFTTQIPATVAYLDTLHGGMTVLSEGGTSAYKALRLRDKKGNEYRMRSLKKNVAAIRANTLAGKMTVDNESQNTRLNDIDFKVDKKLNTQFNSSTHPYAILAVSGLAEAAGLFNNKPQIFYIPKQRALGNFNEEFGDELYLLSLLPTENTESTQTFKYPDDIETTDDILGKLRKGRGIKLDEENYIRSRLFDMLIGDWDREPDHWRWAEYFRKDSVNVYVPIPRNRDQAFASLEGNIIDIARSILGSTYRRQLYSGNIQNLAWFNEEGILLDRALLQRNGMDQWEFTAKQLQHLITDEVIEKAFAAIPTEVNDAPLQKIITHLKARRENLPAIATRYYKYLATLQTLEATDGNDYFEITRQGNGNVLVKEFTVNPYTGPSANYERLIDANITKELWVYGLDGQDIFEVKGDPNFDRGTFIRLIGGQGEDKYVIANGRGVKIYDHESRPNEVAEKGSANLRLTDVYNLNTYDYRKKITRSVTFNAATGYNPDDGFRLGGKAIYTRNSFQRNPFSKQHVFKGGYYFNTQSFDFSYGGQFSNILNNLNLSLGARITSPNYIENYFGYGNGTKNPQDRLGYGANRVQVQHISVKAGLLRNSNFGSFFKLQLKAEAITVNSAVTGKLNGGANGVVDETDIFGTAEAIYEYRSFDDALNPSRGMLFDLNLGITDNLDNVKRVFGFLNTRLGFYNSLSRNNRLVLKTNFRGRFNFGNLFEFYQGAKLGANTGLRGYREERFTGRSLALASGDVRYSLKPFVVGLQPLQFGVYLGSDLGRVWVPNGSSKKWHHSYGGGLWINGRGGLHANISLFSSVEGQRLQAGLGFDF